MERKPRPTDDRDSGELKAWELPDTDVDAPASCPLMEKVTLLPLRYGRTETPPPGSAPGLPYSLKSRPLGYRMLRDGFIYIYDETEGELKEYEYQKNELSGGPMEYTLDRVLYVSFSDVQWTAKKKAQITDSEEERQYWMQRVDLSGVSPLFGGEHLLTVTQASEWVAEFAEDYKPEPIEDGHPEEAVPYIWENQPYYHKSRVGKLLKQQNVTDPDECLCLVLKDDVGVMVDLAEHQDVVVGWLEQWAGDKNNERDYVLGALIESMTLLSRESLDAIMEANRHPSIRAIREDLDAMEPEARARTEEALVEILNNIDNKGLPSPNDPSLPPEVRQEIEIIRSEVNRYNHQGVVNRMNEVVQRWYWKDSLEGADPDFVDRNFNGLQRLGREQRAALKGALHGQGFGARGINDLIDRDAMDSFMEQQRAKLARWQPQLDMITDDRLDMVYSGRLHQATWYFDPGHNGQVEAALDIQYVCLKDICRSDKAAETLLVWLKEHPQYHHPLFQTLPLDDQSAEAELAKTYVAVASAGYNVVTKAAEWIERVGQAEAGKLPQLENLAEDIRIKAQAIGDTLSPAVSMGMARSVQRLYDGLGGQSLPELDHLFRDLPYFFKKNLLKAIEAGEVEFRFASQAEQAAFGDDVRKMLALRERLSELRSEHRSVKARAGHKSQDAETLRAEFRKTREDHRAVGHRVAAALSPINETEPAIRLEEGAPGRAVMSIVAPAAAQEEVGRLVGHFRKGLTSAPKVNLVGDGIGLAVFVVQFANFWRVSSEFFDDDRDGQMSSSAVATSLVATLGAGFLASQSIMDTAYSTRARALTNTWQSNALQTVQIRMGRLHVGLGVFAYGAGAISSTVALVGHHSKWQEAVRRGNAGAQAGAVMSMMGSGGLAVTQSYGLYRTLQHGSRAIWATGEIAKGTAWATTGTTLSRLFFRLNVAGLVFTVFELAGTWVYNRYNLDKRDKWLLTVPWSTKPEHIHNGSLAEYEKALAKISSSVDLVHQDGEDGRKQLTVNCYSLPSNALAEPLGAEPPTHVALAAWQVKPPGTVPGFVSSEVWMPCTDALMTSLELTEGEDHLGLTFTSPKKKGVWLMVKAPHLALMVKVSTRISNDEHVEDVYLLKVAPDSDNPVTPIAASPKADAQWRDVPDPLMSLANL